MNSDYYPAGAAGDPNAPYNEREVPCRDFDCEVSVTLTKVMPIATTCYTVVCEDESGQEVVPVSPDWLEDYADDDRYVGLEVLLAELDKLLTMELANVNTVGNQRKRMLAMQQECRGWQQTFIEIG